MACAVVTVEEGIADEFMEKLVQKASEVKIGNGLDDGVFLGPVIREDNKKRTLGYIQKGIEEGARLVCDGRENVTDEGYFVGPTIFDTKCWRIIKRKNSSRYQAATSESKTMTSKTNLTGMTANTKTCLKR